MIYIVANTVKNALVQEVQRLVPDATVYTEQVTNPEYPHAFIYQVQLEKTEDRQGKYFLDYLMNIRYRVVSDTSAETKLQNKLDTASMALMMGFDIIDIVGGKIRATEKRAEKEEGILQFFLNVSIQVEKEKVEEAIKQGKLSLEIKTQGV